MSTLEEKLAKLLKYPEMLDFIDIIIAGAAKHGDENWLESNGKKASLKDNSASMFRHLAKSSAGIIEDEESGLDHRLHLACRALMGYVRHKRGLVHPDDIKTTAISVAPFSSKSIMSNFGGCSSLYDAMHNMESWDNRELGADERYVKRVDKDKEDALDKALAEARKCPCKGHNTPAPESFGENCISMEQHFENATKQHHKNIKKGD